MLTDAEIDALEGEALDKAVAEYVMGETQPNSIHPPHIDYMHFGDAWYCLPEYDDGDICEWKPAPFSDNILDSWPLVVKYCMSVVPYRDGHWHVSDGNIIAFGDTAPIAICRGALKVVMDAIMGPD